MSSLSLLLDFHKIMDLILDCVSKLRSKKFLFDDEQNNNIPVLN